MHKLYHRPNVVPETIKTSSFNMKRSISTIQDIKETFMLSLLNTATNNKRTIAYKGRNLWNQLPA